MDVASTTAGDAAGRDRPDSAGTAETPSLPAPGKTPRPLPGAPSGTAGCTRRPSGPGGRHRPAGLAKPAAGRDGPGGRSRADRLRGRARRDRRPADPARPRRHHRAAADRHRIRQPGPGAARGIRLPALDRLRRPVLLPPGAGSGEPAQDGVRHHHGRAVPVHADRLLRAGLAGVARPSHRGALRAGRDQRRRARRARLPGRPAGPGGRAARDLGPAAGRLLRPDGQPVPRPHRAAGRAVPDRGGAGLPQEASTAGGGGIQLRRPDPGDRAGRPGRARHRPGHPDSPAAGIGPAPRTWPGWCRSWCSRPGKWW